MPGPNPYIYHQQTAGVSQAYFQQYNLLWLRSIKLRARQG